jgi:hypothetical protein
MAPGRRLRTLLADTALLDGVVPAIYVRHTHLVFLEDPGQVRTMKIILFIACFLMYMAWNMYVIASANRIAREEEAKLKADKQKR